jgi:hypothetical protein
MSKYRTDRKHQARGRCRLSIGAVDALADECDRWALELNATQEPYVEYEPPYSDSTTFTTALAGMGTLAVGVLVNLPFLMT